MTVHHEIPTTGDLQRLSGKYEYAVSIYIPTARIPRARRENQLAFKTAFEDAVGQLKGRQPAPGARVIEGLRAQWRAIDEDVELWSALASSLAAFITPDASDVYVLPNQLVAKSQCGDSFDIGQLLRSVTYPHEAYGVAISANKWSLWHATAERRAARVELSTQYPADVADANNLDMDPGQQHNRRLSGDEGKKVLLDRYAQLVSDAVAAELKRRGAGHDVPLFVFATEPLLSMFASHHGEDVIKISGAPDELKPEDVDRQIRDGLDRFYAYHVNAELEDIADDTSAGLVATQIDDIARAAASGVVKTLLFNFTDEVYGTIDETSGEVRLAPDAAHTLEDGTPAKELLSAIAVLVLAHGGRVLAIRNDETTSAAWNQRAVAHLRHALH